LAARDAQDGNYPPPGALRAAPLPGGIARRGLDTIVAAKFLRRSEMAGASIW